MVSQLVHAGLDFSPRLGVVEDLALGDPRLVDPARFADGGLLPVGERAIRVPSFRRKRSIATSYAVFGRSSAMSR